MPNLARNMDKLWCKFKRGRWNPKNVNAVAPEVKADEGVIVAAPHTSKTRSILRDSRNSRNSRSSAKNACSSAARRRRITDSSDEDAGSDADYQPPAGVTFADDVDSVAETSSAEASSATSAAVEGPRARAQA
eukprot:4416555-Pleurochrysis_carterae.AAC.1